MDINLMLSELMSQEGVVEFTFTTNAGLAYCRDFKYDGSGVRKEPASRYGQMVCWKLCKYGADTKETIGVVERVNGVVRMKFSTLV